MAKTKVKQHKRRVGKRKVKVKKHKRKIKGKRVKKKGLWEDMGSDIFADARFERDEGRRCDECGKDTTNLQIFNTSDGELCQECLNKRTHNNEFWID